MEPGEAEPSIPDLLLDRSLIHVLVQERWGQSTEGRSCSEEGFPSAGRKAYGAQVDPVVAEDVWAERIFCRTPLVLFLFPWGSVGNTGLNTDWFCPLRSELLDPPWARPLFPSLASLHLLRPDAISWVTAADSEKQER